MGKGRKNRKPQSGPTLVSAHAVPPATSPGATPAAGRVPLARRIALQFAAILSLGTALGFVFNAANPIGVRFEDSGASAELRTGPATNFNLSSTAKTPPPVPPQVVPPTTVANPSPTLPPPVTIPLPPVASTGVPTRAPIVISNPPPLPAVAAGTVAPANPAPIHWRDAKPLAAAGQAVLVDVRAKPFYDAGHIPDAVSLPETSSPAEFAAFLKLVPTNTTLIVYCSSTSCSQSKRVADRLVTEFHYAPVKYMTGGYQEYQQEELAKPQPPANQ